MTKKTVGVKNVKKKRTAYKRIGLAAICFFCILIISGIFWYGNQREASHAAEETWENWDLAKMVEPTLTTSTKGFTTTTARATFYDVYSDNQVWSTTNKDYRDAAELKSIEDGNKTATDDGGNTFTHFNYELSHSKNDNGVEYQKMYDKDASEKVYPLYCGIAWPGQSEASRWGSWSKTTGVYAGYTYNGATHGWWFAAANTNQFDNDTTLISDEGTPGGTKGAAAQGLVNHELDENGNVTIGHDNAMRVLPYFDAKYLETSYREGKVAKGYVVSNIAFPFRKGDGTTRQYMSESDKSNQTKTSDKYYYFDSYLDTIQLNEDKKNVTYYHGSSNNNVKDTDGKNGFFPFNKTSDSMSKSLNYVFGVKMELNFNMTSNGKIKGEDIKFEFTGDDDLWVFVDGYLVLDIGGAHIPCHGSINFATKKATVDVVKKQVSFQDTYRDGEYGTWDSNKTYSFGKNNATDDNGKKLAELLSDTTRNHTLTIFYMERGKGNSNLKIKFNLPQISTLSVGNEVDASDVNKSLQTDALWKACNNHKFKYTLKNYGTKESDYNNSITTAQTPSERQKFAPIGLDSYRKKMTSEDGATQRLRFFTFTEKNYYSMVVSGTKVTLPDLKGKKDSGGNTTEAGILDEEGCVTIDGKKYVFLGWTTDETYRDHWEEILNDTYIGGCPDLESATDIKVTESTDYYAVWAKKDLTVTYYDEVNVDKPLGYDVTTLSGDTEVAYIGHEKIDTKELKDKYILKQSTITYWDDSVLDTEETTGSDLIRYNWKTDKTRKGFQLAGWKLTKTKADGENSRISSDYSPLCDVKLYADWTRTCYRALFTVEDASRIKTKGSTSDNTAENGTWQSNIVYFPMGVNYEGYLPYMTDESNVDSFEEISNDVTCYAFTSLPIRENYAIVKWTQNDEDNSSFRTTDMVENGKTLYRQKWTLGEGDVIFTGIWKQITSTITFQSGTYKDGKPDNWEPVKKKYTIGAAINRPERENIFTDYKDEDTNGWEIVGWKKEDTNVSFPYRMTEESVTWTAVWKRINSKVTYHFDDASIGITGKAPYAKYYKIGSNIEKLTLEGIGDAAPFDQDGSYGTKENHTTYYVKANGKAYVINGWKDKDGNPIDDQTVTEEDCDVFAIWEEVHITLDITVNVPNSDSDEWDASKAEASGWNQKAYDGGTTWTKSVNLIPGEKFSDYFDKSSGSLKDTLYGADVNNDIDRVKDIQYDTVVYPGGNYPLTGSDADENAKVPYTAANHTCSVTGNWVQKQIVVTFAEVLPDADTTSARPLGYQIYKVADEPIKLPTQEGPFLDRDGKENSEKISTVSGYSFLGWSISEAGDVIEQLTPTVDNHKKILYTRWEKITKYKVQTTNGSQTTNTEAQSSVESKSVFSKMGTKVKGMFRLFSNTYSSDDKYHGAVDLELYELHDLQTEDEGANGETGSNGEFYLTYDQVASFLNCFTLKSTMQLQEEAKIYSGNNVENTSISYGNMYNTTWELRDIHGYITSRHSDDHNRDLKQMPIGSGYVYDGRVKDADDVVKDSFSFQNENDATGASYATNVRALFTHKIKTSDITITKKLTDTAYSVATRKGELDQEYTFKVTFSHIFGDTTNNDTKLLYNGEYTKLNQYGNYIRDDDNKIKKFTATDGKILVKNGETAIISGIPVMTEYTIKEENKQGKKDMYVLATVHKNPVQGLASENKAYVNDGIDGTLVKNNTDLLKNKKLSDFTDLSTEIPCSFNGTIENSGYTYNYVATNEVLIDGVSLYIEKMIDEFYYTEDDRFMENQSYQQLTGAKQTFIFNIKYTPVGKDGTLIPDKVENFQYIVTFNPEDDTIEKAVLPQVMQTAKTKKGYKKTAVVLGLESGYYEISEDENWSWKYDLMGVYAKTQKNAFEHSIYEAKEGENASHEKSVEDKMQGSGNKVYRCYIRGQQETLADSVTEKTYDNKVYQVLDNAEEPSVCFLNLKATDGRQDILGDTDVVTNIIAPPTPTPNPDVYKSIELDETYKEQTLLQGECVVLPNVKAQKKDGTIVTIGSDDPEWNNIEWSVTSGTDVVTVRSNVLEATGVGESVIKVSYKDKKTTYETTMRVSVVAGAEMALSGDNKIPYSLFCSTADTNNPASKAVDGDSTTLWITKNGTYGTDVFWGLQFQKADASFTTRKVNKVTITFEPKDCTRTIQVYGITGMDNDSQCIERLLETKNLNANVKQLSFDITPGNYYGIKIVFQSLTGTAAPWPAIAEVKIQGW